MQAKTVQLFGWKKWFGAAVVLGFVGFGPTYFYFLDFTGCFLVLQGDFDITFLWVCFSFSRFLVSLHVATQGFVVPC